MRVVVPVLQARCLCAYLTSGPVAEGELLLAAFAKQSKIQPSSQRPGEVPGPVGKSSGTRRGCLVGTTGVSRARLDTNPACLSACVPRTCYRARGLLVLRRVALRGPRVLVPQQIRIFPRDHQNGRSTQRTHYHNGVLSACRLRGNSFLALRQMQARSFCLRSLGRAHESIQCA